MEFKTDADVIKYAKTAANKTVGEIDQTGRSKRKTKGSVGHIIEESLFGYEINSNAEADLPELGIEIKTTGVKKNKNKTLSAKERLVLNIINYIEEASKTFETSSFWTKNQKLLILFYLWAKELKVSDYYIIDAILYTYPEKDLEIIKNDWQIIHQKILDGKAHELSESDTMYLSACTKGSSAKSVSEQPFSDIPAKQRAYSLKQSYMTSLVRQYFSLDNLPSISSAEDLENKTFEELLYDKFKPYINKDISEIAKMVGLDLNISHKSRIQRLVSQILGVKGNSLNQIEEFSKANIQFKTIRLEPNGIPKEHMSFEQVDFNQWIECDFDDSVIYRKFEETKFLFVVFKYSETKAQNPDRKLIFKGVLLWNMPKNDLETYVYEFWNKVKEILDEGVELKQVPWGNSFRVFNNLPGSDFNEVIHLRPKARDGNDKTKLPDGQYITKQAYWLDRKYIAKIISTLK